MTHPGRIRTLWFVVLSMLLSHLHAGSGKAAGGSPAQSGGSNCNHSSFRVMWISGTPSRCLGARLGGIVMTRTPLSAYEAGPTLGFDQWTYLMDRCGAISRSQVPLQWQLLGQPKPPASSHLQANRYGHAGKRGVIVDHQTAITADLQRVGDE